MKPYISTFVVSDDLIEESRPNNKKALHIVNPQNVLRPAFVPGTYSFAVTFGLLGINPNRDHKLNFTVTSENEIEKAIIDIGDVKLPNNKEQFDTSLPLDSNGLMFNMDFRNVPFRSEGKYFVNVLINDELIGRFPFLVYAQERE